MAGIYYNGLLTFNTRVADYTLAASDQLQDTVVEMNVGIANTVTIPLNSSVAFPIGSQIVIAQYGSGQTTIAGAVGVTLR